jgi:hypothetical protein
VIWRAAVEWARIAPTHHTIRRQSRTHATNVITARI